MKLRWRAIIVATISIIFVGCLLCRVALAEEQNVVMSIYPKPKIDIVLAKSRTSTNLESFATEMKSILTNELESGNFRDPDINVQAIEAETVELAETLSWKYDKNDSIGKITTTNHGKDVEMVGNQSLPGKNALYIMPEGNKEQKFTFQYSINYGDSFNAAGMLLRVKEEGEYLTGYMLSFNKENYYFYTKASNKLGALWKFRWKKNDNSHNMNETNYGNSLQLISPLDIKVSGSLTVVASDSEIKITGGGLSSSGYTRKISSDENDVGNGYGFFSDHYDHNCEQWGQFKLTGINLEESSVKSFSEVLRMPEWRTGVYKFLVYVDDNINEELQSGTGMGELISRLINDNIYFVGWSTSKNSSQIDSLIQMNNGQGKNVDNSSMNLQSSCTETAKYIRELLGSFEKSQYILVDEPINIEVDPPGIDKDSIDNDWPYGKWSVEHEYKYFDNDMGQYAQSGQHTKDMIKSFDKTGRYEIKYKDQNITPKNIYVHRKPQADFTMQVSGTNIALNSISFDEDKEITDENNNKGISEVEWKYKKVKDSTWQDVPSKENSTNITIEEGEEYQVQLRVKDLQETWSDPKVKYTTNNTAVKPIAMFTFGSDTISKYEELEVKDSSYDPAGGTIQSQKWDLYKGDSKAPIKQGQPSPTVNFNTSDLGAGEYKMALTVQNSRGLDSETYYRTFTVTNDTISPEFVAEPTNSEWTKENVKIDFEFKDRGGSGFKSWKYAITDTEATPSQYSEEQTSTSVNEEGETLASLTVSEEGQKYVHVVATDKEGNNSINRILGPYKIDHTEPTVTINGDRQTHTRNPIELTFHSTDPLSGIKEVRFNGQKLEGTENTTTTVNKNGTYTLQVEDIAGNVHTEQVEISNIYQKCNAGLEHPDYPTSLDSCPICDLITNLEVTNNTVTYNSKEQGVTYQGADSSIITEYYNNQKVKPIEVGTYNYELKVKYNGVEYKTGKVGTFTINPKVITIQDIVAKNREYNATNVVELEGGTLVGVEESDIQNVQFVLPKTGTIPNKDVGQYNVTISEITLTGTKAKNYTLTQPLKTDVTVGIRQKEITIENITATTRQYNATNVVELNRGNLVGIEEIDKDEVDYVLSETGTIANKDIGEYNVVVPEITLTGEEAKNYHLNQPAEDAVKVVITQKEITIENITATTRQYNATNVVELNRGNLVGIEEIDKEEVDYVLSETGTIANKDIGEYNVVIPEITLIGEEAKNYHLNQPEEDAVKVEITPKDITIENITANSRQYNATNVVELNRGNLVGIEEIDKEEVDFELSETGTTASKNIGEYNVVIPEITLTGEEAKNYHLIQPAEDAVKVEITPKDITIENVTATSRQYDGTNIVELNRGNLVGVEELDKEKVDFELSETGTIANKNIGEYNVVVPEITLIGEEATNYHLIQPAEDAVKVEITKREITIEGVKGKDRKYDKTDIVEVVEGKLQNVVEGEDVKAVYPKTGKAENSDIGEWTVTIDEITLIGEDIDNYELKQPETEDILVTISKPDQPYLTLSSEVEKINGKSIEDTDKIRYGDELQFLIKIRNIGPGAGYAQKVENVIPKGMEFVKNNEINKENGWEVSSKKGTVETEILNFESGEENEITQEKINDDEEDKDIEQDEKEENTEENKANNIKRIINDEDEEENKEENDTEEKEEDKKENNNEENNIEEEIRIVLKVTDSEGKYEKVKNENIITQADIRGEEIKYEDDENKIDLPITISYSDLSINQKITQIKKISNTEEELDVSGDGKLTKVEVSRKKDESTKVKITYGLEISNKGNAEGTAESIIVTVPDGMSLSEDSNREWKEIGTNMLKYNKEEEINQGEIKNIELSLEGIASETMGEKKSEAMIISKEDADQRKVEQGKNEEITIKNVKNKMKSTNNYSSASAIISVSTGIKNYNWNIVITLIILIIILIYINYYVYEENHKKTK